MNNQNVYINTARAMFGLLLLLVISTTLFSKGTSSCITASTDVLFESNVHYTVRPVGKLMFSVVDTNKEQAITSTKMLNEFTQSVETELGIFYAKDELNSYTLSN